MSQFKFETYVTKLDFGVLGFLWCSGSPKDKTSFLYDLAKYRKGGMNNTTFMSPTKTAKSILMSSGSSPGKESKDDFIVWSNPNLKHIFKRIFSLSIDLAKDLKEEFEPIDILDIDLLMKDPVTRSQIEHGRKNSAILYDYD